MTRVMTERKRKKSFTALMFTSKLKKNIEEPIQMDLRQEGTNNSQVKTDFTSVN